METSNLMLKIFFALFLFNIVAILVGLAGVSTHNPAMNKFNSSIINLNTSTTNLIKGFNSTITATTSVNATNCAILWVFSCNANLLTTSLLWLSNGGVTVINGIYKFVLFGINLIGIAIAIILVLANVLFVLLPALFFGTGIVGNIIGIGFSLLIASFVVIFGKSILEVVSVAVGVIGKFI